jgi:hypothetical protein
MKFKRLAVGLLLALMVASMAVNAILYQQNRTYKHHNRELILQNDSILSVNLELINGHSRTNKVSMVN